LAATAVAGGAAGASVFVEPVATVWLVVAMLPLSFFDVPPPQFAKAAIAARQQLDRIRGFICASACA